MVPHTKLTVDGEPGTILARDAQMTFLSRDSGKVDLYQTAYVQENGELFTEPEVPRPHDEELATEEVA